jgi:hypothetical protein
MPSRGALPRAPVIPPPPRAPEPTPITQAEEDWLRQLASWDAAALEQHARQGIDPAVRGSAWPAILGLHWEIEQRTLSPIEVIIAMGEPRGGALIEQDVVHSLRQTADLGKAAPDALQKLLVAYANLDPDLGYVRGMAFIAAVLLIHIEMPQAFWSFVRLMAGKRFQFRRVFVDHFDGLNSINVVWQGLLAHRYRKVAERLVKNEIHPQMYTTMWFLTAFLGVPLLPEIRLRIFDRFVACGCRALLSFGIAIIARLQDQLTKAGTVEALLLLQNLENAEPLKDVKAVIAAYDKAWVSEKDYERFFKKAGLKVFK